jgi:hypothetical protein
MAGSPFHSSADKGDLKVKAGNMTDTISFQPTLTMHNNSVSEGDWCFCYLKERDDH